MRDADIDFTDIALTTDWSKAVVGEFYLAWLKRQGKGCQHKSMACCGKPCDGRRVIGSNLGSRCMGQRGTLKNRGSAVMLSPVVKPPGLVTGERLTVEEFLRRWEELPDLKNAELIDGVVYVSSPLSLEHGSLDFLIHWWLAHYAHSTPGCKGGSNSTWLMSGSAPQPDAYLRILPSHGGQSWNERQFGAGAPELAVEICVTSTEIDFGPKLALYERAGVREYITVEQFGRRMIWRVLENGS